jgi:phosphatidylserine/phosphatidylglycerophosphate/cardiolipin synthase-like enzyme
MKTLLPAVLLLALAAVALAQDNPATAPPAPGIPAQVGVYFSPKGGCTDAVVKVIDGAKTEILVQAYSFTSAPIAKALVDAHTHGSKLDLVV